MPIIATASWSIPKKVADRFAQKESGLSQFDLPSPAQGIDIRALGGVRPG